MKLLCKECQAQGHKSVVYEGHSYTTLAGFQVFYDQDGFRHEHDPNSTTTNYTCSNGHAWSTKTYSKCQTCDDWTGDPQGPAAA
jgi:hypothetical protein